MLKHFTVAANATDFLLSERVCLHGIGYACEVPNCGSLGLH